MLPKCRKKVERLKFSYGCAGGEVVSRFEAFKTFKSLYGRRCARWRKVSSPSNLALFLILFLGFFVGTRTTADTDGRFKV
jgi:hypothetical protein